MKLWKETGAWWLISAHRFQRRPTWPSSKQLTDKTSISKNTRKRDRDGKKRGRARTICCFILLHAICSSNFEENSRKKKRKEITHTKTNRLLSLLSGFRSRAGRRGRRQLNGQFRSCFCLHHLNVPKTVTTLFRFSYHVWMNFFFFVYLSFNFFSIFNCF